MVNSRADNVHTESAKELSAAPKSRIQQRLRLSPFAKGLLTGLLISLAGWALLVFVAARLI